MILKKCALAFAFFLALIIAIGFLFYEKIINTSLQFYLSRSAEHAGYILNYQEIRSKPGEFVFLHPSITFGDSKGHLEAKSIRIQYTFAPFERLLNLEIFLEKAGLELAKGELNLESLSSNLSEASSWLTVHGHLKTDDAKLSFKDSSNDKSPLYLNVDHSWGDDTSAFYKLQCKGDQESCLELHWNGKKGRIFSKNINASALSPFIALLSDWSLNSGKLEGAIDFSLDPNFRLKGVEGDLLLKDVSLYHKKSNIRVELKEMHLGNSSDQEIASLDFAGARMTFSDDELYGMLRGLKGKIALSNDHLTKLSSDGIWTASGQNSYATLTASISSINDPFLQIKLDHLDSKHAPSLIEIRGNKIQSDTPSLALNFDNVREREFGFAQRVFDNVFPDSSPVTYLSGTLNASVQMHFQKKKLSRVIVDKIKGENCFLILHSPLFSQELAKEFSLGAKLIEGYFSFDLTSPIPKNSIQGDLLIKDGELALTGFDSNLWNFTHIDGELKIEDGELLASTASLELAGLKGKAKISGKNSGEIVRLELSGKASDLKPFMPTNIQKGIDQTLFEDQITLHAQVKRIKHGADVQGTFHLIDPSDTKTTPFSFGFILDRHFNEWDASVLPTLAELGYSGFTLRNGSMKCHGLDLEKYISPSLFPDKELLLSGTADIHGAFDLNGLTLTYEAENVQLENEKLLFTVPRIEKSALHNFSFTSPHHYGIIPIENGSYLDKDTGLLFTGLQSEITLTGQTLQAADVAAFTNGLYFGGDIHLDYSSPEKGTYDILVRSHTVEGTFSQAQDLFKHFDEPYSFTKIPMEGLLSFGKGGAEILFEIKEDDYHVHSKFDCVLTEGKGIFEHAGFSIQDLNLNISFDKKENILELSDIQGMVLLMKDDFSEEYALLADKIRFDDFEGNLSHFDLQIKNPNSEFVRVKGKAAPLDPLEPNTVEFTFDTESTHFSNIYPKKMSFVLTDWNRLDKLEMNFGFRLSSLLHELQNFQKTGLPFVPGSILKDLHSVHLAGGDFDANLTFDGNLGKFEFNVTGKDVSFDQYQFKDLSLNGYKQGNRWSIEQLALDQLSLSSELLKEDNLWKIDFLGLKVGKSLLVGIDGAWRHGEPKIHAHVNLFEIDLDTIGEWMQVHQLLGSSLPKGKLKGTGELVFTKKPAGKEGWTIDALLDTSLRGVVVKGVEFGDMDHLSIHYLSEKSLSLRNANGKILPDTSLGDISFGLSQMSYDFASETLSLDGLKFAIDAKRLPWLKKTLLAHGSPLIDDFAANLIGGLKTSGTLTGSLNYQSSLSGRLFDLTLADGRYTLFEKEKEFKDISLSLQEDELKISALSNFHKQPVWISARMMTSEMNRGSILLADTAPDEYDKPALIIHWVTDPEVGLIIQRAAGYLAGFNIDLAAIPQAHDPFFHRLTGSVAIDGKLSRDLLPPFAVKALDSLEIGKGYNLNGEFQIAKNSDAAQDKDIRFFGMMTGKNVELKGYQFEHLSSQVIFQPSSITLSDLTISDLAGIMHIGMIQMNRRQDDRWALSIPMASIYEMKPSMLKEVKKDLQETPRIRKPLVVEQLFIQNITGILGDSSSFKGSGNLHFINPPKDNIKNFLFTIPKEILTRIGLNLSVLTPVTGTVHFNLDKGAFVLTKLKDVYSEGKISKFYLPSSGVPSTVDFDGNINAQVRFKQSTLLLKLAEFFTITVQGTLKKPSYSLQRQKYLIKQEEVFPTPYEEEIALP